MLRQASPLRPLALRQLALRWLRVYVASRSTPGSALTAGVSSTQNKKARADEFDQVELQLELEHLAQFHQVNQVERRSRRRPAFCFCTGE